MLRLKFYSPGEGSAESIEPGEFFRFIGSMLCRGSGNDAVATWMSRWMLRDAEFARAESMIRWSSTSRTTRGLASCAYGPFDGLHVTEGAAWGRNPATGAPGSQDPAVVPAPGAGRLGLMLVAPPGKSRFDLAGDRDRRGQGAHSLP